MARDRRPANELAGEVQIDLGEPHKLKLTHRGLSHFRQRAGISIQEMMFTGLKAMEAVGIEDWEKASDEDRIAASRKLREVLTDDRVVLLLWAMLLYEDRNLTVERVEEMMDQLPGDNLPEQFTYLLDRLMRAFNIAMGANPEAPPKKKTEPMTAPGTADGTTPGTPGTSA